MKKELKMKHIFIPVIVVVVLLGILAAFLSQPEEITTPTDGETVLTATDGEYHTHADGSVHYGEH